MDLRLIAERLRGGVVAEHALDLMKEPGVGWAYVPDAVLHDLLWASASIYYGFDDTEVGSDADIVLRKWISKAADSLKNIAEYINVN